jgi:hypothetical protein
MRVPVPQKVHHPAVAGVCVCHHPAQALSERGLSFFVVNRGWAVVHNVRDLCRGLPSLIYERYVGRRRGARSRA